MIWVRLSTASSISFGYFRRMFNFIFWLIMSRNCSQFIIPFISDGLLGWRWGEASMHRRIEEWSEHRSNKFFTKWLKFGGILATNISRISGRFLGDDGQYVGLGGARIDNCLLLTAFSRACPFGLVVWQPHDWCLAFRSPPMMKYWLRSLKKFSKCVYVILWLFFL